jgi:L-rhamnonate dehydratase
MTVGTDRIVAIRASVVRGGGADYSDQAGRSHWIDGRIATPMSVYGEYRETRSSFGLDVLGSLVVEVEDGAGRVGVGVSTGGVPGCWVVEEHLSRFVVGRRPAEVGVVWDQMFRATLFYGRKGLVLNAISAVDLALWDLLGRQRELPVFEMLGGPVREELVFYATGPRPDVAKELGFIGGKLPLEFGPWAGQEGLDADVARLAEMRAVVGDGFWLMYDCWMALDVDYALRLLRAVEPYGLKWLEEFLPPDDYWGYARVRQENPTAALVTTGEHEATLLGFRMLLEMGCADIIQPDVTWCGGLTELVRISALADAHRVLVIPHGSSVYSYHFVVTQHHSPFAEFLMMHPDATEVVPMFDPLLLGEPVPVDGRLRVPDLPGFGVELNRELAIHRPFPR